MQAHPRDIVGLVLDPHNTMNIAYSESHEVFGLPGYIKVMFTLCYSLLSNSIMAEKNTGTYLN